MKSLLCLFITIVLACHTSAESWTETARRLANEAAQIAENKASELAASETLASNVADFTSDVIKKAAQITENNAGQLATASDVLASKAAEFTLDVVADNVAKWTPRIAMVHNHEMKCSEEGFACWGRVQIGPDACGDLCQFDVELNNALVLAGVDSALKLSIRVGTFEHQEVFSFIRGAEAIAGQVKTITATNSGDRYVAMNHFKNCIPIVLPIVGLVGVCSTFERIINDPQGLSNDFSLSLELGQLKPVIFQKRMSLNFTEPKGGEGKGGVVVVGGVNCGGIILPHACLTHSQCGWCTHSQLCLPDGATEQRHTDMLGTCSRCSYFPGKEDAAGNGNDNDENVNVSFVDKCSTRVGCGACRDRRKGLGASLVQSPNCIEGDKRGPTGTFDPCFDWVPSSSAITKEDGQLLLNYNDDEL